MKFAKVSAIAIASLAISPEAGRSQEFIGLIAPQYDQVLRRPEIVRLQSEKVYQKSGIKTVIVGNARGRYTLSCNFKAAGCLSPISGRDYYVIKKETRWRMPGAMRDIDLVTMQDFTATYFNAENVGLVRADSGGEPDALGMYTLGSWEKK